MSETPGASTSPSRREFAAAVALAAGGVVAGTASAEQAETPKPATPAQLLADVVRLRHGKHLSDEQLQAVQRSIGNNLASAERLRRLPLTNADEPAVVFSAD